jgi:hypothetical protein
VDIPVISVTAKRVTCQRGLLIPEEETIDKKLLLEVGFAYVNRLAVVDAKWFLNM